MTITITLQRKLDIVRQKNEIYKTHWVDLCNKILYELEEDGWCRLSITKDEALKMRSFFDELD
ncbi:MAG TPA: hypothetical protein VFD00_04165 [Thermoclostridium sp.]|nr:hypothetical protein [Thermoclostridium sp.]